MSGIGYPPEKKQRVLELLDSNMTQSEVSVLEDVATSTMRLWLAERRARDKKPENVSGRGEKPPPLNNPPISKPKIHIPPSGYITGPERPGIKIGVIPDMQVKPGIDLSYCSHIGRYLADKKPDVIVNGGDFADMPSLSTYDAPGSRGMEGQRYKDDILSVQTAMRLLMTPIKEESIRTGWNPRLVFTLGNHEDRIRRAIDATPKLDGVIGLPDLHYEEWGWEVYPFLEPVVIAGIVFSHYFCSGVMGRPITTARALLTKKHMSCFAFHQQGRDIAFGTRADGRQMIAIIAGSCYDHEEAYLNPQTNNHWRGLYMLNDTTDGAFEESAVSLRYLRRKYGN